MHHYTPLHLVHTHTPGNPTLNTFLLPSRTHTTTYTLDPLPSLRQHTQLTLNSKTLSDPQSFPIDVLSPPVFPPLLETSGHRPQKQQLRLVGGLRGLQRRGGAGQTEPSHSCPLPQASSTAGAWSVQWGPDRSFSISQTSTVPGVYYKLELSNMIATS